MQPLRHPDDRAKVAHRIADIEARTAGEIVVHVVDQSDDYSFWRLFFAVGGAVALSEAASLLWPEIGPYALESAVALAALLWFAFGWPPLLGRLVPRLAAAQAVHRRAAFAFVDDGVHHTRDASGVLVFLSRLERRVEILADAGIHARVGVEGWTRHVETIVSGLKQGDGTERLLEALDAIGAELEAGFPPRPDDENELENHVIVTAR